VASRRRRRVCARTCRRITPSVGLTQTLDQLRGQGQAGERFDGYLVPRGNVPAQVRAVIADTNAKRQAIYQK